MKNSEPMHHGSRLVSEFIDKLTKTVLTMYDNGITIQDISSRMRVDIDMVVEIVEHCRDGCKPTDCDISRVVAISKWRRQYLTSNDIAPTYEEVFAFRRGFDMGWKAVCTENYGDIV
jgi:hypothetical protein